MVCLCVGGGGGGGDKAKDARVGWMKEGLTGHTGG